MNLDLLRSKILFLGPSKYALEDFDYSILKEYDFIARTNKFLETEDKSRCDIIFINSNCVNFYYENADKLKDKIIYVKRYDEKTKLKLKYPDLDIHDLEEFWKLHLQHFHPHQPYYGTLAINYLRKNCQQLDIAGIDFYYKGFSQKCNYIEGYYDLRDLISEDSQHSIKKDIEFMKKILDSENIRLLHKTKDIFRKITNE